MGLEKHERITEDALARMLKESVQTSYRRGGEETSLTTDVKKTDCKKIRSMRLNFLKNKEKPEKKKKRGNTSISRRMRIMRHFSSERKKVI